MAVTIRQIGPSYPTGNFAGEVTGIDLRRTPTPDEVAAIRAGMDKYAVHYILALFGIDVARVRYSAGAPKLAAQDGASPRPGDGPPGRSPV